MSDKAMLFGWLAALTAAAGCIHEPAVYDVGDEARATQPQQPPVATYPMPPTDPKGMVYVMSLGPERLPTASGAQALFLHVRVAVENNGDDTPWQIDPNDELAGFGNGTPVPPAFAEASTGGPVLTVSKGSRGHMDLFYPLPSQGEPPRVALSWRLHRSNDVVAQTTSFDRPAAPPQGGGGPGYDGYAAGSSYYRPYGSDVRLSVGLDWWWPWGFWGGWGWGWGWPYRPYYAYPFYPRNYYGYRGGYAPAYRGGYGGRWVAPSVGGNWRGTAPSSSSSPLTVPRTNGSGGGASGKSGWRGGGRR